MALLVAGITGGAANKKYQPANNQIRVTERDVYQLGKYPVNPPLDEPERGMSKTSVDSVYALCAPKVTCDDRQ